MPLVSLVIPVYNTEHYLGECLDSVLVQTEHDIEIICVNDGSTDGSAAALTRYAAKDRRIHIITQPNAGLSAARNSGLDRAMGEFVMFLDSDDWLPNDAVAKMVAVARASGAPVVVSNGCAKNQLPGPRKATCHWRLERPAFARFVHNRKIHSSAWNKLYRRDAIGQRRFIPGIYFEDWPFNTELFGELESFALVDEPMYVYRTNGDSITRSSFTIRKAQSYLTGIAHVTNHFRNQPTAPIADKRIAIAVKMLVNKTMKSRQPEIVQLVCSEDFSHLPLDLKTKFRLWYMRRRCRKTRYSSTTVPSPTASGGPMC